MVLGLAVVQVALADGPSASPQRVDLPGIENAYRVGPRLYSGGEPQGEGSFRALQALGIKTVVTVDGAMPDLETAHRYGLKYVHLPVGYDGIPRAQALRIIKAVRDLPGPVFVHCHHGKHRGPTAVAVCGIGFEGWSAERAVAWLKQAGTAPAYSGLYRTARDFTRPTAQELERAGNSFPEKAEIPAFVETMVRIDRHWDRLKALQRNDFKTPASHPDLDPPHETLQLAELFREASRSAEARQRGDGLTRRLAEAATQANALRRALLRLSDPRGGGSLNAAGTAFQALNKMCAACHAEHRDR